MKTRQTGIKLRKVDFVRSALFARWTWGVEVDASDVRGMSGRDPLPFVASSSVVSGEDDRFLAMGHRRSRGVRSYMPTIGPCPKMNGAAHVARLEVPEWTEASATSALSKKTRCLFCKEPVPPSMSIGTIDKEWVVSTDNGICEPGMMLFMGRLEDDGDPSTQALMYSSNAFDQMMIVVLPDGSKWDVFSQMDEDGDGWTITGKGESISTDPVVDTGTWCGVIKDGELCELVKE